MNGGSNTDDPILTIALSTIAERCASISGADLVSDPRWRYLVLCQRSGDPQTDAAAAQFLAGLGKRRADVSVRLLDGRGAARSRNAALRLAATELLLFTDDDVGILADGVLRLIEIFRENPRDAIVVGRTIDEDGAPLKPYPKGPRRLSRFNCARVGTVELAVRPSRIRETGALFDERFGAGSDNRLGDEYIFITDCLKRGLHGRYVPVPLARHVGPSSGADWTGEASAVARARVFERVFGSLWSFPVKLAFLAKNAGRFAGARGFLAFASIFLRRSRKP